MPVHKLGHIDQLTLGRWRTPAQGRRCNGSGP
jgi:hypothetical protein